MKGSSLRLIDRLTLLANNMMTISKRQFAPLARRPRD